MNYFFCKNTVFCALKYNNFIILHLWNRIISKIILDCNAFLLIFNTLQMKISLSIWETNRNLFHNIAEQHTVNQLNTIPQGLSTNLIWNIAHVIVSQQKLIYTLSGLSMQIDTDFFERYQNGSKPTGNTSEEEILVIKNLLKSTVSKTREDFEAGLFKNFQAYQTKTGFYLESFEEAIAFNNYHEGIHLGMMLQIKKLI